MASTEKLPNVARAGAIMMAFLLLSRVLGIARDTVMSASFGIGAQTDAYRLAFQIPDLLFFLIAGGALSSAFIPVFSEYLYTEREDEAWHVFSVVTTVMSIVVVLFIVLASLFAMPLTHVIAPSAEVDSIRPLIAQMSRIVLPAQYAFFIGGLMFGTLYARQRFVAPALGPNVYNLGIIFGALVLAHSFEPGIVGMSWGALLGAITGNLLVPLVVMRGIGLRFRPSLDVRHPGVKKVFLLMLPVVLGLSLPGVYGLIMQGFGSYFHRGTNTALDLSNKLMQAPLGVFGQSLALAVFPALTQFFAQQRMDLFRAQFMGTLRTVLFLTLPVTAIMLVLSPDIVTLFFAYGKGARSANIGMVSACLQMFALGVTAWCLHPVLMRGFFALQSTVTPILIGTLTTAIFVGLIFALMATGLGYLALPLASSLSAIALAILLLVFVERKVGALDLAGLLATLAKSALGAAAMAALLLAARWVIPTGVGYLHNVYALVKVGFVGVAGAWLYYLVARMLKMPETAYVDRALARLSRRTSPAPEEG